MNCIVPIGGGNNNVNTNHGLIPASLHLRIAVAAHNQTDNTTPTHNTVREIAHPTNPIRISVKGELNTNNSKDSIPAPIDSKQPMRYVPQYSLREDLPSKAKYFLYFSILFITLTSLLVRYYQWWLTVYS